MKELIQFLKNNTIDYPILIEYCDEEWQLDTESGELVYEKIGEEDWNYSEYVTEGYIKQDGYLVVNLDLQAATWVTVIFDLDKGEIV